MKTTTIRRLITAGIILLILVSAVVIAGILISMKQPPAKKQSIDNTLLVETTELKEQTIQFKVATQGTVTPRITTTLSAEISGRIIYISDKFVAGGVFEPDEVILEIDPTDYKVAVAQAKALVKQRTIEYDGAKSLRKKGYRAEAELASAETALAAARASLVIAEKNLDRTKLRLPYKGMIREKIADLGQYVNPGSKLAVIFDIDTAEIRLPLSESDLSFLDLPLFQNLALSHQDYPEVTLSAVQKGKLQHWKARIIRTEGVVDESSRVTYAVAEVVDPYLTNQTLVARDESVLPVGTYVTAEITGISVADVIKVPRSAVRGQNELLFVDEDNKLEIRQVDILRTDEQFAYINGGAEPGERISVTAIESPINGMQLRTTDDEAKKASEQGKDTTDAPGVE